MAVPVFREDVQKLVDGGACLVEVLPSEEYEELHIAGAINVPLKELGPDVRSALDPGRPIVVYCYDALCDLSPRAARRLETLGFTDVYDYVAGKTDWVANSLPCEGRDAGQPRIGTLADRDVTTCGLDETIGDVSARAGDDDVAVVVDDGGVVLGLVGREALHDDPARRVEDVMHEGPSTYRPDVPFDEMVREIEKHVLSRVLITNADGTLFGIAAPSDIESAAKG